MKIFKKIKRLFNKKVLLCDLDGTLIVTKSGKTFPENEYDWKFKPGINFAIRQYNPRYIFIITNQGGIEKGLVDENKFIQKFIRIMDDIRTWGDFIVDGIHCSSNDKKNYFRKPNIGMVEFFRNGYCNGYDFDRQDALMIGDASGLEGQFSDSDLQCAKRAGIKYCDVDKFIEASNPCVSCEYPHCGEELYDPYTPCYESYRNRLKKVLTYKP